MMIIVHWREYTTASDYSHGETNLLIHNFKIPVLEKHRHRYKLNAIKQLAREFIQVVPSVVYSHYTFVPIATAKTCDDAEYDDRLIQLLHEVASLLDISNMDIRKMVIQTQKTEPVHTKPLGGRLSIMTFCELYQVQINSLQPKPHKIVIFDDVLTKGSHFKAMQKVLQQHYPDVPIMGLFIARSINPEN